MILKTSKNKLIRLGISACFAISVAACSALPGGLPNAQSIKVTGSAGEAITSDSELDDVNKGFGKSIKNAAKKVANAGKNALKTVNKNIKKFDDAVTDAGQVALDETVEFAKEVGATLEDFVLLLAQYCNLVESKIEKWQIIPSKIGFNPFTVCNPTKDDNGYFLFGKEGGGGVPAVFQQTMYLSIKSGSKEIKATLLKDEEANENKSTDAIDSFFKDLGLPKLLDMKTPLERLLGKFAIVATNNPREGWYLYLMHENKQKFSENAEVKKVLNYVTTILNAISLNNSLKGIKEGSVIKTKHAGGVMNYTVIHYLFGSHKVAFDKI